MNEFHGNHFALESYTSMEVDCVSGMHPFTPKPVPGCAITPKRSMTPAYVQQYFEREGAKGSFRQKVSFRGKANPFAESSSFECT